MEEKVREKEKKLTRGDFLKLTATAAVGIAGLAGLSRIGAFQTKRKKRYGMVIDLRRCIGCFSCQVACKAENEVPLGVYRNWVKVIDKGRYPMVKRYFLPRRCNHCENPPCVSICPVKASYKRDDGLVLIRKERCIGCKMCIGACPYNARFINFMSVKGGGVADKCTFCSHRIDNGVVPACVATCIGRAIIFGDLNDPESEIARLLSSEPTQVLQAFLNTEPQVYYIGADEDIMGATKEVSRNKGGEVNV